MNFVTCDHDLDTVIEFANKQVFDQIFAPLCKNINKIVESYQFTSRHFERNIMYISKIQSLIFIFAMFNSPSATLNSK